MWVKIKLKFSLKSSLFQWEFGLGLVFSLDLSLKRRVGFRLWFKVRNIVRINDEVSVIGLSKITNQSTTNNSLNRRNASLSTCFGLLFGSQQVKSFCSLRLLFLVSSCWNSASSLFLQTDSSSLHHFLETQTYTLNWVLPASALKKKRYIGEKNPPSFFSLISRNT